MKFIKNILVIVLCIAFSISAFAQQADKITGNWLNDARDAKVEIYKSGNKYFGKITWTKEMYASDGTLKKDTKNPNESLRSRTVANMVILSNFSFEEGEWIGGEVYDPKSGKTYKSKMKLNGTSLEIRGYVGSPMFGKTTTWTRVS